jgi:hypothetical protein
VSSFGIKPIPKEEAQYTYTLDELSKAVGYILSILGYPGVWQIEGDMGTGKTTLIGLQILRYDFGITNPEVLEEA